MHDMTAPTCLLCGLPVPKRSWLARVFGLQPRTHQPSDGDTAMLACWRTFNRRMGLDPDRPMPKVGGGRP